MNSFVFKKLKAGEIQSEFVKTLLMPFLLGVGSSKYKEFKDKTLVEIADLEKLKEGLQLEKLGKLIKN